MKRDSPPARKPGRACHTTINRGSQQIKYAAIAVEMGPRWELAPERVPNVTLQAMVRHGLLEILPGPRRYIRLTPHGIEFRDYWIRVNIMRKYDNRPVRRGMRD